MSAVSADLRLVSAAVADEVKRRDAAGLPTPVDGTAEVELSDPDLVDPRDEKEDSA